MKTFSRLKLRLLPPLGYAVIRLLAATLRMRTLYPERVEARWAEGKNVIIAFWHSRQLMMPLAYKGSRAKIFISSHVDEEWIARILTCCGCDDLRGSYS